MPLDIDLSTVTLPIANDEMTFSFPHSVCGTDQVRHGRRRQRHVQTLSDQRQLLQKGAHTSRATLGHGYTQRTAILFQGKEVFNSYGRRDNHHLLIYYGLCAIFPRHYPLCQACILRVHPSKFSS